MTNRKTIARFLATVIGIIACTMVGAVPAAAVDNGPTSQDGFCMQSLFGLPVTSSNAINCTANDVRIARATSVNPTSCIVGSHFDLEATFEIVVTSDERYRPAFFFRTDGGPTARGATLANPTDTGSCSVSRLDPDIDPALQLNNSGDTCGDLNSGTYEVTFSIPGVLCQDNDGDGFLNLPNCTSWGNNKTEVCDIEDEFDFAPYNKSKCVCDDAFNVPVIVETASITVTKTGSPGSVPESGGAVFMNTTVTNNATFVDWTIDSITDTVGLAQQDLTTILACTGSGATATQPYCTPSSATTSCPSLLGTTLAPGASVECQFSVWVQADTDDSPVIDTVEWCGTDSAGHPDVCDDDDEDTSITDVPTVPSLTKTAISAGCTVDVNYTVVVSNPSDSVDVLTIEANGLNDDKFGDLTSTHVAGGGFEAVTNTNCGSAAGPGALPIDLNPGDTYTCMFTGQIVSSNCNINHVNKTTATTHDDDGETYSPFDTANVTVETTFP